MENFPLQIILEDRQYHASVLEALLTEIEKRIRILVEGHKRIITVNTNDYCTSIARETLEKAKA